MKAEIFTAAVGRELRHQKIFVGFNQDMRLEFADIALNYGYKHSLDAWKNLFEHFRRLGRYGVAKKKQVN